MSTAQAGCLYHSGKPIGGRCDFGGYKVLQQQFYIFRVFTSTINAFSHILETGCMGTGDEAHEFAKITSQVNAVTRYHTNGRRD